MGLKKKYQKSLDEQWCMRFNTRHPDGDNYVGVVTHIKPKFIALAELRDFEFDGVEILPKKFIKGYRDSKYQKCANELIRENGEVSKLQPLEWLDECETIRDVITQLYEQGIWPGVERLYDKGFYIGPITEVAKTYFALYCYDAAGYWESNYKLKYRDICRVNFGDRYGRNFNAYMLKGWDPEGKGDATESTT